MNRKYISDVIDVKKFKKGEFNLIASGCGTGKSYFCANNLLRHYENVKPCEVLYLTSRAVTVDQQTRSSSLDKYDPDDLSVIRFWNDEMDGEKVLTDSGIQMMTYDKLINILIAQNCIGRETLRNVKIVVLDECHVLFSDTFMSNVELLKVWIRDVLYRQEKIMIGITATPKILHFYQAQWGVKINQLNEETLVNYKANQLICTNFFTLPQLLNSNRLKGKTIVMCRSITDCFNLQEKVRNSAVLISKNNRGQFTKEMFTIRQTIVEKCTLPKTFRVQKPDGTYVTKPLDVLICTSTLREGFNLLEESGVKNVVCCYTDELHITQFLGRCRFNVDTLIVAGKHQGSDNIYPNDYLQQNRQTYAEYFENPEKNKWFESIACLVEHGSGQTLRRLIKSDVKRFLDYVDENWALKPLETKGENFRTHRLYKEEDKEQLVKMAKDCKIFDVAGSLVTANRVISYLEEKGYSVKSGRLNTDGGRFTYKTIYKNEQGGLTEKSDQERKEKIN